MARPTGHPDLIYMHRWPQKHQTHFITVFVLLGLLWAASQTGDHTHSAYSQTESYWEYDAPGRINNVQTADINRDGFEELLLISGQSDFLVLGADGDLLWKVNTDGEPIIAQAILHTAKNSQNGRQVIIGTRNQLQWYNVAGIPAGRIDLVSAPIHIAAFDHDFDGVDSILIASRNGRLQLYDSITGGLIWNYVDENPPNIRNARPQLITGDFDNDGSPEIIFGYRSQAGLDRLVHVSNMGHSVWSQTFTDLITHVTRGEFTIPQIIIATNGGEIYALEGSQGIELWQASLDQSASHIISVENNGTPSLIVATTSGELLNFNRNGQSLRTISFNSESAYRITALHPTPSTRSEQQISLPQFSLHAIGVTDSATPETVILDQDGRSLKRISTPYDNTLSHLVDLNRDGHFEFLRISFGNITLQDSELTLLGQSYQVTWRARLPTVPIQSVRLSQSDISTADIAVAGEDGRLYILDGDTGDIAWQSEILGEILQIHPIRTADNKTGIWVTYQREQEPGTTQMIVFAADGSFLWDNADEVILEATTYLTKADLNQSSPTELIFGTTAGHLYAYSLSGQLIWHLELASPIKGIYPVDQGKTTGLQVISENGLFRIGHKGEIEEYQPVSKAIIASHRPTPNTLFLAFDDQTTQQLDISWQLLTEQESTTPTAWLPLSFAADQQLDSLNERLVESGEITANLILAQTETNDSQLIVGTERGRVQVWNHQALLLREHRLGSRVTSLTSSSEITADTLVVGTENGVVQRLDRQANRPPLLVSPEVRLNNEQYGISLNIIDLDQDRVVVSLLGYDQNLEEWRKLGEQISPSGNDRLFWVTPPLPQIIRYRFSFDDGTFIGLVSPDPALFPPMPAAQASNLFFRVSLIVLGCSVLFLWRYTPRYRARQKSKAYQRLIEIPQETLAQVETLYIKTIRRPADLLEYARQARATKHTLMAQLLEGLYLFQSKQESGLQILQYTLKEAAERSLWGHAESWHQTINHALRLSAVASPNELAQLHQEVIALANIDSSDQTTAVFTPLQRPFTSLQEADRQPHAPNRLPYFYESLVLIEQAQLEIDRQPAGLFRDIAAALLSRWRGVVKLWVDDWRGRPWLQISLKTKRIVAREAVPIVLEIENLGQAPAEQVRVTVQESSNFSVINAEQVIAVVGAGRTVPVSIQISLHNTDSFRLIFNFGYEDNQGVFHTFDFADMVHFLGQEKPFRPIPNPYAPGTPLRAGSDLFVGREALMQDVVEQVSNQKQAILVIVGQRRTGKTSTLLHLDSIMPDQILPVYVDGQSLGTIPGLGAFFHDISWLISDAILARYDKELEVPDLDHWDKEGLHLFQRHFLPQVQQELPVDGRVLLVFDEFEVFESLVRDGILPATFFPVLRHLMQHSTQLNFVFAGTHRLEEIASEYWSVLFNLALHRQINYLQEEAAEALITRPIAGYLLYDDLALDRIWRATSGHPYFLQLVCYTMVAYANQTKTQYITISDVNASLKEMLQLGEVHFVYIWREADLTEQTFLVAIAHIHPSGEPIDLFPLIEQLREYDFVFTIAEARDAFRRLEHRGIVQELRHSGRLLYTMRIDLIRLWVRENRSLAYLREVKARQSSKKEPPHTPNQL